MKFDEKFEVVDERRRPMFIYPEFLDDTRLKVYDRYLYLVICRINDTGGYRPGAKYHNPHFDYVDMLSMMTGTNGAVKSEKVINSIKLLQECGYLCKESNP